MEEHKLTVQAVLDCQFNVWYPQFSQVTFKSKVIQLPETFEEYLSEESVFMPASLKENEEDKAHYSSHSFQLLEKEIDSVFKEFSGKVFVKLNWKAPKDGAWVVSELKCINARQIYQLLKCSDLVKDNLGEAVYEDCIDKIKGKHKLYLILRKWHYLKEWMEFRCYVYNNELVGISQRNCEHCYAEITQHQAIITDRIKEFYNLSLIHICRCRRLLTCRSRWSP
eukprot:TRINITY_DN1201_c0_g2_i3.p1 TRINITY_DN1201_c0_g2~~TRINITY_DN1201_c0_g2_i3.p1  ORF type:complete len:224 (-),score=25.97 TRINITY_DN1201_c0_g2_i3:18-689(-)